MEQRKKYLLETYVPRDRMSDMAETDARLRVAAGDMEFLGRLIVHVETLLIPDEETCFFVFEATRAEDVAELSRRAAIGYERIVQAM